MFEEEEKRFLESFEPSHFVTKLEEQLQPYYEAEELTIRPFVDKQGQNFVHTLPSRCWNEKSTVDFCAYDLLDMVKDDSFEGAMYTFVGKQLEDETKHYLMLARIYEGFTGTKFTPRKVTPLKSQVALFSDALKQEGGPIQKAIIRFVGEGGAYHSAKVTADVLKGKEGISGKIGRAYETIARDELFHQRLGQYGLNRFSNSEENRHLIQKISIQTAGRSIRMFFDIYGYNKEAAEIMQSNYDIQLVD